MDGEAKEPTTSASLCDPCEGSDTGQLAALREPSLQHIPDVSGGVSGDLDDFAGISKEGHAVEGGKDKQNKRHVTERALQKTPFGLNRYVLLLINIVYSFATARVYFGWPNLSNMLFRAGAYSWECDKEAQSNVEGKRYLCVEQDSSVQLLFVLVCATAFCCSLLSGSLMDWKGPKITAVWGQFLNATAWFLLAFSSEGCPTYIPSMILMGLGADAGFLPATNICNLFPKNEKLVIAIISAAMSASFAIPTILDTAWMNDPRLSLKEVCLWYAGFGPGLAAIVAALFFPQKIYVSECELIDYGSMPASKRDGATTDVVDCDAHSSAGLNEDGQYLAADHGADETEDSAVNKAGPNCSRTPVCCNSEDGKAEDSTPKTKSLRQQLCSKHFWSIYIYWPLNAVFYSYYLTSAENLFGRDVNSALGIMGPLSLIPSVILGKIADKFGVMFLMAFIIGSAFFMYSFAIIHTIWSYYTSAVFSMLYVSCFSGQLYSYVNDTFESIHFGKIVGLVSATGGLLSLLRGTIHIHLTMGTFHGNYTYTCILMLTLVVICCCIVVFLFFLKRAQPKAYLPPVVPTKPYRTPAQHISSLPRESQAESVNFELDDVV